MSAKLAVGAPQRLSIEIDAVVIGEKVWREARIECGRLSLDAGVIGCEDGALRIAGEKVPVRFSYDLERRDLKATLAPADGEEWRVRARFGEPEPRVAIEVKGGRLARLSRWIPSGLPQISTGTVIGTASMQGTRTLRGEFGVEKAAFSDSAGTRAGEGISATVKVEAERDAAGWRWQAACEWRAGEVFWQPVYLEAGGQRVVAQGEFDNARVFVREARATVPGIGVIDVSAAAWDRARGRLDAGRLEASRLPMGEVYEQWLKPFFAGTVLSDLRAEGEVSVAAGLSGGVLQSAELDLANASVEDRERRFALFGATGRIPWRRDARTKADIAVDGGEVLRLPFGALRLPFALHGERVAFDRAAIPVLGGTLTISNFAAARDAGLWRWRFGGELAPVSVDRLTQVLGWPMMHGTLSGAIPQVRYERSTLSIGGTLTFNVFDGTVAARNVVLIEPLGRAPRFNADLEMRRLDLDLLTRAFSFGNMTGRVDATVGGLELVNWKPVRFDARIESSPGDYPRTISQTAVENISALGGAGAAAAIQRSVLRFFDRFGYEKLGLSCILRNDVCEMAGIGPAAQGSGYVIVEGGGIPALSVIGYNRSVSWSELVSRLKRIMQDNVQAVIK